MAERGNIKPYCVVNHVIQMGDGKNTGDRFSATTTRYDIPLQFCYTAHPDKREFAELGSATVRSARQGRIAKEQAKHKTLSALFFFSRNHTVTAKPFLK